VRVVPQPIFRNGIALEDASLGRPPHNSDVEAGGSLTERFSIAALLASPKAAVMSSG